MLYEVITGRVKIAFQGIVNSRTNNISFHECLIRMIDEKGEVHSAGKFIGAIERMGLTRLVDMFATREAIRELKEFPGISLSVNVSNHTFTDPDWLKSVNRITSYNVCYTKLLRTCSKHINKAC